MAASDRLVNPQARLVVDQAKNTCPGGCWIGIAEPRQCSCVKPREWCGDPELREDCNICNRGFGVYATEADCMANGEPRAAPGIDPMTYPADNGKGSKGNFDNNAVTFRTGTSCPFNTARPASETRGWCPFYTGSHWENANTWGGKVPTEGSDVRIPDNSEVLISSCSFSAGAAFKSIIVPATSRLLFADNGPIDLVVGSIRVHGQLLIGSPSCRIQSPVRITFKRFPGVAPDKFGIVVGAQGSIQVFGRDYGRTWTRLEGTVEAGSTLVRLRDPMAWEAGMMVVLVTSYYKDLPEANGQNQNEVRRIVAVEDGGRTLRLDAPVDYPHEGNEYQSEVGLLSRSIVFRDDPDAPPGPGIGPHISVESRGADKAARFSGVMAERMGQTNTLGRYSFHFHHNGLATSRTQYFVSDCTCYQSRHRCVTVHGTSNMMVSNNVAFDVIGSGFYLETGVEERNAITANLAAFIRPIAPYITGEGQRGGYAVESEALVDPVDAAAAGFYGANMFNIWKDNAASGGYFGFSFPVLNRPVRDFQHTNLDPSSRPFIQFNGNTAHSSGYLWKSDGACIYTGGSLYHDASGKLVYSTGRAARNTRGGVGYVRMVDTKVWLCNLGITHWGNEIGVFSLQASDVMRGAQFLGRSFWLWGGVTVESGVPQERSGFPRKCDGTCATQSYWDDKPLTAFQWYDTGTKTILHGLTVKNVIDRDGSGSVGGDTRDWGWHRPAAFWSITWSDFFTPEAMSYTRRFTYSNVPTNSILRLDWADSGSYRYFNWIDWDGSSTGGGGQRRIIGTEPSWWKLGDNKCDNTREWGRRSSDFNGQNVQGRQRVWVCDQKPGQEVARLDVHIPGVTTTLGDSTVPCCDTVFPAIGHVSQIGWPHGDWRGNILTENTGTIGVTGLAAPGGKRSGWFFHYNEGAPQQVEIWLKQLTLDVPLVIALRYPSGTTFTIKRDFTWYGDDRYGEGPVEPAASLDEFKSQTFGTHYWVVDRGGAVGVYLYLSLVNPGPTSDWSRAGVTIPEDYWQELSYRVDASCAKKPGSQFCALPPLVRRV